ncbi:MAG: hypothetical protein H0X38_17625, partial [Planctomycetes bacterium]|nr:hypothetical protein [Planctomycetota bacterium]
REKSVVRGPRPPSPRAALRGAEEPRLFLAQFAAAQVALAVGDARLPLTLEPGAWRRIHVVGDAATVALAGSSTRVALTRPVEALGVAIADADVDIGEVVVLEEGP